jgi:hypothetical protein
VIPEEVANLCLHALGLGAVPSCSMGLRLYESGVDADGLGSFNLRSGQVDGSTSWYAGFWRRFWYEDFTGKPSRLAPNLEPAPDQEQALSWVREAVPSLRRLEQRAMRIAGLTKRHPLPVSQLKEEQALLRREREQLLLRMMAHSATGPATVAMIRDIHNDDVVGLTQLAERHVKAYHRWRQRVSLVGELLSAGPAQMERRQRSLPMVSSAA